MRIGKHWHRLHRDVVDTPSWEPFNERHKWALRNLI